MKNLTAIKKSKKGYTLIELIVVLVIVAILAAIAVPSLIGYIDKAKSQQTLTEARAVYVAAQAIATEDYANGVTDDITASEINTLIGADYAVTDSFTLTVSSGSVTAMTYTSTDGYTATYDGSSWTVAKD